MTIFSIKCNGITWFENIIYLFLFVDFPLDTCEVFGAVSVNNKTFFFQLPFFSILSITSDSLPDAKKVVMVLIFLWFNWAVHFFVNCLNKTDVFDHLLQKCINSKLQCENIK